MSFWLQAIANQRRDSDIKDAMVALVVAYYDEYGDATEIEGTALATLDSIGQLLDEIHVDVDVAEVVREAERKVRHYNGRPVRTPSFYDEEDE